jgi:hypothetical protein
MKNPFLEKQNSSPDVIPFDEYDFNEVVTPSQKLAIRKAPPPRPKEESSNNDFLSDLRDFMNDFAETDLNLDSVEEINELTEAQANFYIKLYNQVVEDEYKVNKLCDEEIERTNKAINIYREKRLKEFAQKKEYFKEILKNYALDALEGKKTKTLKLPYGNLSFKKQQPKYNYNDEAKIKKLLNGMKPELIKTKTTTDLDKAAIKKYGVVKDGHLYIDNVLIEDVTIENQEDKFEIK